MAQVNELEGRLVYHEERYRSMREAYIKSQDLSEKKERDIQQIGEALNEAQRQADNQHEIIQNLYSETQKQHDDLLRLQNEVERAHA